MLTRITSASLNCIRWVGFASLANSPYRSPAPARYAAGLRPPFLANSIRWVGCAFLANCALAACASEAPSATGRIELHVAPLLLPKLADACYGVTVLNESLAPVWSRANLCASTFGHGTALTYVGTCDAFDPNEDGIAEATVVLTIDALFALGNDAPLTDFRNPCAAPYSPDGCRFTTACRADADTFVEFNLTVMRQANQGFFDIAVTFDDIFCSAKVDCATAATESSPARPLLVVFDPQTGERVPSVVWAFACTDGDPGGAADTSTHLYMDDLVLFCGNERYAVSPSAGPGNVYPGGVGAPAPLVQAMVFEGREALQSGGHDADQLYWNVALGLDAAYFVATAPTCVLETKATAHRGPLTDGITPTNTHYPVVTVSVPLNEGATTICTRHPLDGQAPHDGVATTYTGAATATFGHVARVTPLGVESAAIEFDECTLSPCGPNATCTDASGGYTCACLDGYQGNAYTGCTDIDECASETDNCHQDATCANSPGTFTCECPSGYSGDGTDCVDIDGCLTDHGGCSGFATCENQPGPDVICECLPGYVGDGLSCAQTLTITSHTANYDVFAAAGSPTTPRDLIVTVQAGVTVSASSTAAAAWRTGPLPAGSTVRLVNLGQIYGAGGRGGNAGDSSFSAAAGAPGGDAIDASVPLTIDNTAGAIFGGGGGGGGGNICTRTNVLACGGSGGGGRGQVGGAAGSKGGCASGASYPNGTSGAAGTVNGQGQGGSNNSSGYYPNQFGAPFYCTSGYGGAGGDWGQAGLPSGQATLDGGVQYAANAGGAAGYAVRLTGGATLTWLGGHTVERVKGLAQ